MARDCALVNKQKKRAAHAFCNKIVHRTQPGTQEQKQRLFVTVINILRVAEDVGCRNLDVIIHSFVFGAAFGVWLAPVQGCQ